jgi:ethanolamine utilization protein EutA
VTGHRHDGHHHDHDHGHHHDGGHQHDGPLSPEAARLVWELDHVELTTVGIDIGSATSHVMFARVVLERQAQDYSNRFVLVEREVLYQSPVRFTQYVDGDRIDVEALRVFVADAYREAGLTSSDVDAGAVILTGVALERANSRAIADLFAEEGGKFVCAAAGHNLEALLAAHGSGAVALSAASGEAVLNLDIGGGTTKLALAGGGEVLGTLAVRGGGRLLAWDAAGRLQRVEASIRDLAIQLDVPAEPGQTITPGQRAKVAASLADRIVAAALGEVDPGEVLAGELPLVPRPERVVVSGGVAAYLTEGPDGADHGDLGPGLAAALRERLPALGAPVDVAVEPIRATVIGASQFSVQVSGNTVHASDALLPMHNVPVVAVGVDEVADADAVRQQIERGVDRLDLREREEPIVVAVQWRGEPSYRNLRAIADGLAAAHRASPRAGTSLLACVSADVAASLGGIVVEELGFTEGVIVIDGVDLADLDFLDIGQRILPANVVPVVVKSLLFPAAAANQPLAA